MTQRKIAPIDFDFQGSKIEKTRTMKYLGCCLDTKCTFEAIVGLIPIIEDPKQSKCSQHHDPVRGSSLV